MDRIAARYCNKCISHKKLGCSACFFHVVKIDLADVSHVLNSAHGSDEM